MEIHKPHPVHGWREFLKEYGIIVLGVLTALAAEQTVEWLHWRDQVQEGRAAIRGEMQLALDDLVLRRDLAPCVERRTAELEAWADSYRAGRPLTPKARVGRIIPYWPINQVWETFRASPVAMHMATDERMRFAQFYGEIDVIRSVDGADRAIWLDLQEFNGAPALDLRAQMRLRGLAAEARQMNASYQNLSRLAMARAKALGVTTGRFDALDESSRVQANNLTEGLCQPLFGSP